MDRRLPLDTPGLVAAMIDPLLIAMALQVPVRQMRPLLTPDAELLLAVQATVFCPREPFWPIPQGPHRYHHMDVEVPLIAVLVRRMKGDVDHITLPDELLAGKVLGQPFTLLLSHLVRQRN